MQPAAERREIECQSRIGQAIEDPGAMKRVKAGLRAAAFRPGIDDLATTRRQIRIVAGARGIDPGILDGLAVPAVGYWLDDGASRAAAGSSSHGASRLKPPDSAAAASSRPKYSRSCQLAHGATAP